MSYRCIHRPLSQTLRHARRGFSLGPNGLAEVKTLGVVGAGQMVGAVISSYMSILNLP